MVLILLSYLFEIVSYIAAFYLLIIYYSSYQELIEEIVVNDKKSNILRKKLLRLQKLYIQKSKLYSFFSLESKLTRKKIDSVNNKIKSMDYKIENINLNPLDVIIHILYDYKKIKTVIVVICVILLSILLSYLFEYWAYDSIEIKKILEQHYIYINNTSKELAWYKVFALFSFILIIISLFIFLFSNRNIFAKFSLSLFTSIMATASLTILEIEYIMNVDLNPSLEINMNHEKNKNTSKQYNFIKVFDQDIFFDKSSFKVNSLDINNPYNRLNKINISKLLDIFDKKDIKTKFNIQIYGYSSIERITSSNTISNNFELSLARANSTKEFILNYIFDNNILRENIIIDTYAKSNILSDKNHDFNRRVNIKIYKLNPL